MGILTILSVFIGVLFFLWIVLTITIALPCRLDRIVDLLDRLIEYAEKKTDRPKRKRK